MGSNSDPEKVESINRREVLKSSSAVTGLSMFNVNVLGDSSDDMSLDEVGTIHATESGIHYSGVPDGAPWLDRDPFIKYHINRNRMKFTPVATALEQRQISKSRRIHARASSVLNQRKELVSVLKSIREKKSKS